MKVAYCSDLHLDSYPSFNGIQLYPNVCIPGVKILIIAGDLGELRNYKQYKDFLDEISNHYEHVIIVFGNHEMYGTDIDVKVDYELPDNFHMLNNNTVEIEGHVFYGGTCWPNLEDLNETAKLVLSQMINDFSYIKVSGENFQPDHCIELFNGFHDNILTLDATIDKPYTVITHFAPTEKSIHPNFKGSNINSYFCNDLESFIETSNIDYWICGHVHHKHEYTVGNTKVLCNPRGYWGERRHFGDHSEYSAQVFEIKEP